MTIDRLIHLAAGIILLLLFLKLSKTIIDRKIIFYSFISMAIGTWTPDWDLYLGIGFHRSPLTHSLLPALVFGLVVFKYNLHKILIVGFCIGLSSHLLWDIVFYGNVQWITGGNNDRLFLLINSILLILASMIIKIKFLTSKST